MSRDLNDTRQNKRLAQIQAQYDRDDDEAMRAVLATEPGRQVVMRLARDCRWLGDPWDANSVRLTDYESGRRAAGIASVHRAGGGNRYINNAEANARLIAQAPALFWFVEQIFNGLDTGLLTFDTPADEVMACVLTKGRAALAGAKAPSLNTTDGAVSA